jgi:hypothetical protein
MLKVNVLLLSIPFSNYWHFTGKCTPALLGMLLILTESRETGTDETKRAKNSTLVGGRSGYCESV